MSDSDSIDPVVQEMDVYINSSDLSLYLLQFPLRPAYSKLNRVDKAKIKQKCKKMQLELQPRFNMGNNNNNNNSTGTISNTKEVLVSSSIAQRGNLGIGVIIDNALHITPLTEVLQMRPSFSELKVHDTREGNDYDDDHDDSDDDDDDNNNSNSNSSKSAKLEQVHMKKRENERTQTLRLQSYAYLQQKEDSEYFQGLQIHEINSTESVEVLKKLKYCI